MNKQKTYKDDINYIISIPLITIWLRGQIVLLWAFKTSHVKEQFRFNYKSTQNMKTHNMIF